MSQTLLKAREQEYRSKVQNDLPLDYSLSAINQLNSEWQKYMVNAKIAWGKLTEHELIKSGGHIDNLAGLIHERYSISRIEAERQVSAFLQKKYS